MIIDPVARALTHLVVAPRHHRTLGRLVPVELVEAEGDPVRLRCTTAQFHELDDAEETQFVPVSDELGGYGSGEAYSWPYFGLEGSAGAAKMASVAASHHDKPHTVVSDRVPIGEVQVRRGDQVHATDGWIGSVQGLVIDPADHHVTHVLLQEGHLWGRKQITIPIGATSRMDNGIRVTLTKRQVEQLPPVALAG